MNRKSIFSAIEAERKRQDKKWSKPHPWGCGSCSSPVISPAVKAMVLAEECGEVSRAVLDRKQADLHRELIQVAAVAVAWLESL